MINTRQHILKALNEGIRFDQRKLLEWRPVVVEYNVSVNAEGSARVKFGDTELIVGIKLSLGEPYLDTPDEGALMVEAELSPMSNPEFEAGPPDIQAVELARVVDRGIREAKAIDMKKLCIEPGKKCWVVNIDVVTINDNGNLLDAAALAALAALKNTRFPKLEGDKINYKELTNEHLPMRKEPIAVTIIKIGNNFIVDPTSEEEKIIDAKLTVTSTADETLCALQKGGDKPISIRDVEKMVDIGIKIAHDLRKHLESEPKKKKQSK